METQQSIERLVPDTVLPGDATGHGALALHVQRYEFAARHLRPGRALDIACGAGYGTRLLAQAHPGVTEAVGVDLSEDAVAHARRRYPHPRARYVVADAMRFQDGEGFDSIVTLETIEHLPDPQGFVGRLRGLLRPGGVLIGSVPTTPSVDANPYHLHDFTERSFRRMFTCLGLREVACFRQVQPYSPLPVLARTEARAHDLRRGLPRYYARHPGSLLRRIYATLRHGFVNHYITVVWTA